jgi:hypothetical protein
MAELNRAGRYDRMADGVERVTGRPAMSVREFVSLHADELAWFKITLHKVTLGGAWRGLLHRK